MKTTLALILLSAAAQATQCPNLLYYKNGQTLKSVTSFFYQNGTRLNSGNSLYHANGTQFKSSVGYYYPNGTPLKSASTLYYPNGNQMKTAGGAYYQNGNALQSGSSFYYENGNRARTGGKLYNPDGTPTAFPLNLESSFGAHGALYVRVTETSESYTFRFTNLLQDPLVSLVAFSPLDAQFELRISNGYPNQFVRLKVNASSGIQSCELESSQPGPDFTIVADAATATVRVNPGYDPVKVKDAIERALQGL